MLATLAESNQTRWTHVEELLALNAELVDRLTRVLIGMWSKKGTRLPDPLRITRPGEKPPTVTAGQLARRMLGRG